MLEIIYFLNKCFSLFNEWFYLLRDAFNESANYLAWSFYSLLSAYIFLTIVETRGKSKLKKLVMRASMVVFWTFAVIAMVNFWFMSLVFGDKFGVIAQYISFFIGIMMIIINSYPVVRSIIDENKNDGEGEQVKTESV